MTTVRMISLVAGDSLTIAFSLTDQDGAALDLTSATIKWWLALKVTTAVGEVPVKKGVGTGVTIVGDPTAGNLEVEIEPADTIDLAPATYVQELEVTTATGKVYTAYSGSLMIKPGLIR